MRQRILTGVILGSIVLVAYLGGGKASSPPAYLSLLVLLSAVAPAVAAFAWPPWLIAISAIFLIAPIPFALIAYNRWAEVGPALGILLFVDFLAVCVAWQREKVALAHDERDAILAIGRLSGNRRSLLEIADALAANGERVLGPGQVQLWILDDGRQELRLVPSGDAALRSRSRAGNLSADEVCVPLLSVDACAQAVRLGALVEAADKERGDRESGTPLRGLYRWLEAIRDVLFGSASSGANRSPRYGGIVLAKPLIRSGLTVGAFTFRPVTDSAHQVDRLAFESIAAMCSSAVELSLRPAPSSTRNPN